MIRTIKWYLTRDLLKATGLATVVFTLVMAVFAVLEPLRNRGMSGTQALLLFGYSMPVMFSFTLPVAVLFASTIVYGRFSQDNELMACRASGISTIALLSPAMWLGLIVTLITLLLTLYVAPGMLLQSKNVINRDLERIVFHGLRSQRQVAIGGGKIFHADQVDPENRGLGGVVALDSKNPNDPLVMTASKAYMEFAHAANGAYVVFYPDNPVAFRQFGGTIAREDQEGIRKSQLEDVLDDEPRAYDLSRLLKVMQDPRVSLRVRNDIEAIQRQLMMRQFSADTVKSVRETGRYVLQRMAPKPDEADRIEFQAAGAEINGKDVVLFNVKPTTAPATALPEENPVLVRQYRGKDLVLEMRSARVVLAGMWDDLVDKPKVWVSLHQSQVAFSSVFREIGARHDNYTAGPFVFPEAVVKAVPAVNLDDLLKKPEQYKPLGKMIDTLRFVLTRLTLKAKAELNMRLAYSTSCLFMVMMGAALGLLLRGGQALSAFAISAIPAAIVILMLFSGKEVMRNQAVAHGEVYGTMLMWGGVLLLATATLYVYIVPVRR